MALGIEELLLLKEGKLESGVWRVIIILLISLDWNGSGVAVAASIREWEFNRLDLVFVDVKAMLLVEPVASDIYFLLPGSFMNWLILAE